MLKLTSRWQANGRDFCAVEFPNLTRVFSRKRVGPVYTRCIPGVSGGDFDDWRAEDKGIEPTEGVRYELTIQWLRRYPG
jgi:hypothetical protein